MVNWSELRCRTRHRMCQILLLLAATLKLLTSVRASGCPALPRQVKTCSCHEKTRGLDLSCDLASAEEVRRAARALTETGAEAVWYLKLRNVRLQKFPKDLLGDLRASHFIAINCSVQDIEQGALSGLADHLESLDLGRNRLGAVPTAALRGLRELASLNLNYNRIEYLHEGAFDGLVSLLRLLLFGNRIAQVDAGAFTGVGGNLTQVNLGENRLERVPAAAMRPLAVLQRLQLHENDIRELSSGQFLESRCESLDVLELANNGIEEVPGGAFVGLLALNSLDLDDNRIREVNESAFSGIEESLEWLKMGGNLLERVPKEALRPLTRLRQLDLRRNRIGYIGEEDFIHYGKNLKFLYLQKNRLLSIEVNAFIPLSSLEWLYLQSNLLETAPYETYRSLMDTLQTLDFHENPFVCDCRLSWVRDWVTEWNRTVVNLPMETRCQDPSSLRGRPVADLSYREMGCVSAASLSMDLVDALLAPLLVLAVAPFFTLV